MVLLGIVGTFQWPCRRVKQFRFTFYFTALTLRFPPAMHYISLTTQMHNCHYSTSNW